MEKEHEKSLQEDGQTTLQNGLEKVYVWQETSRTEKGLGGKGLVGLRTMRNNERTDGTIQSEC